MITREGRCTNFNHGRSNAPVRFCSTCGEVVNKNISAVTCSEEKHGKSRLNQNKYCVACGEIHIKDR